MALSFEQFKQLRAKGLSVEQIRSFETGNKPRPDITKLQKEADIAQKKADYLSSPMGMTGSFIKGLPSATAQVLVQTPAKFIASAAEVPETFIKGKASQREYKIPGLQPFKSYISEAETRAENIVFGDKPLYTALTPFISVPLAGIETAMLPSLTKSAISTTVRLSKKATSYIAGKTAPIISKGVKAGKGILTAGKELKSVESQLAQQPLQRLNLQNAIRDTRNVSKENIGNMTQTFKNSNAELNKTLMQESQLQSETIKSTLKELFRDTTKTYRIGLDKVENILAKSGTKLRAKDYLDNVINPTIGEAKLRAIPEDSSAFKLLNKIKKAFSSNGKINFQTLKIAKNRIYDTMSSGVKTGTKFSEIDDQLAGIFLKKHGDFIAKLSPELRQLNKEFSSMANARGWAMKNFRPYNDAEIQKGANILAKIAKGEVPDKTAINYLKILETGSGRFTGAGELTGKTGEIGKQIRLTKENFDLAKYNLTRATDLKINNLRQEIAILQAKGIELGQRAQKLKELVRLRNIIIGATIAPSLIKKLFF